MDAYDQSGPAELAADVREGGSGLPETGVQPGHGGHHGHDGTSTSVRTATHRGHEIRVETTYRVTIDGVPLDGGLDVLNNGAVHYHGLPQYAVASALDMLRLVIDHFGTEPPATDELAGYR